MADEKIGSLYVQLEARTKKLERQLKSTEKQSKKAGAKSGKAFSIGFAGALATLFAFKKAFDFASQAKNAARDAVETENKFNTVFSSMREQANLMAVDFAQSFGIASSTARELLGNTGDLLVGFGFTEEKAFDLSAQVNALAQDLASFTNFAGGAAGASAALTKGILGETESVKALGIVLRQNTPEFREQMRIKTRLEGLTENQARAEILLAEAVKQSSKAVGDYARTKNDLANVERRLNEEYKTSLENIGQGLLPLYVGLTQAGLGWLSVLNDILGVERLVNGALERQTAFRESLTDATNEFIKAEKGRALIQLQTLQAQILAIESQRAILKASAGAGALFIADMLSDEDERLETLKAQATVFQNQLNILNEISTTTSVTAKVAEQEIISMEKKIELLRAIRQLDPRGQEGSERVLFGRGDIDKPPPNLTAVSDELENQEDLWGNLADAQSTAMGQLAASWATQIKLFSQANSMLQQFLNTLVQVALQQLALQAIGTFAGGGILGLVGGLFGSTTTTPVSAPATAAPAVIQTSVADSGKQPINIFTELDGLTFTEQVTNVNQEILTRESTYDV